MKKSLYYTLLDSKGIDVKIMDYLNKAEVIFIDNVADYFLEVSDKEEWNILTDFPNIAPPFKYFFMEYKFPSTININNKIIENEYARKHNIRDGILFYSTDLKKERPNDYGDFQKPWPGLRWHLGAMLFVMVDYQHIYYGGAPFFQEWQLGIDEYGKVWRSNATKEFLFMLNTNKKLVDNDPEMMKLLLRDGRNYNRVPLEIALLAISFMHCKNVKLIQEGKGTYKGKRNRHKPSIKFKTLHIDPMKEILRTEGQSEKTGLKMALHICRGHFKDYREHGLFGNSSLRDIYWWDSHVRGSIEEGIVNKDYSVNPKIDKET